MIHFKEKNMTVFQSSLYMTTSAVIESNEAIIMTDPNFLAEEIAEIRNFINERLGTKDLYIIYTHSDFDHIIGSGAFPEAKVIATEELVSHSAQKEIMKDIFDFDRAYYINRSYVPTYPVVDFPIVTHGQKLHCGDLSLTFYKAPGHTSDSLFTIVEPYGIFLAGDYLSDVEFPFIASHYQDYVDTMNRAAYIIDHYDINYLIPGHGSVTKEKQEIIDRINFAKYYLQQLKNDGGNLENECRAQFQFFEGMKHIHLENKRMARLIDEI